MNFELDAEHIAPRTGRVQAARGRRGISGAASAAAIEALTRRAMAFRVSVPSWGVGTGGTRFARFPGPGEPRSVFEKLEDCEIVCKLVRSTPGISLHIPWDKPDNAAELRSFAQARGLFIDSMNSNTFEDQPGQPSPTSSAA
jgi:L-rhamnose isomerase/sugar isomerase